MFKNLILHKKILIFGKIYQIPLHDRKKEIYRFIDIIGLLLDWMCEFVIIILWDWIDILSWVSVSERLLLGYHVKRIWRYDMIDSKIGDELTTGAD